MIAGDGGCLRHGRLRLLLSISFISGHGEGGLGHFACHEAKGCRSLSGFAGRARNRTGSGDH